MLTYTVGSVHIKPAITPKRLKIKPVTINSLYKVVHWLLIAAKMYDLCARFKVTDYLNAAKTVKYRALSNDSDAM